MKKLKNSSIYIILHIALFILSFSPIFGKIASGYKFLSKEFIFFYSICLIILFLYTLLWQKILKKLSLTIAFANKSIIILWGMVWGILFFNESISLQNILGIVVILIGIFMVISDE